MPVAVATPRSPTRRSAGGSTPTTGSGVTPARWRDDQAGPRRCSRLRRAELLAASAMILIGVAAIMAVAAWVVVLLSPSSQRPEQATGVTTDAEGAPLTTLAGADSSVPTAAQVTGRSIIALQAPSAHGTVSLVGVAVAEGGLVATTADFLRGVRQVSVIGPGGRREPAPVIGFDSTSDIALVEVPEDLPVARFVDSTGLAAGAADLWLSLAPSGSTMALACTPGSVTERRTGDRVRPGRRHAVHHVVHLGDPRHGGIPGTITGNPRW